MVKSHVITRCIFYIFGQVVRLEKYMVWVPAPICTVVMVL